jgi:hypothetical protein
MSSFCNYVIIRPLNEKNKNQGNPCVYFYKYTTFRRLPLSPSSGEEDKDEGGLVYMNTRIEKVKSKKGLNWTKMHVLHSWAP